MLDKNPETRIGVSDIKVGDERPCLHPLLDGPTLGPVCWAWVWHFWVEDSFEVNARDAW